MKTALRINFGWSSLMLVASIVLAIGRLSHVSAAFALLAAAYVLASFYALRRRRWAVAASVVAAALLLLRRAPAVAVNSWMFFSGHPLYLDSPGTIIVVALWALLFVLPALVLCGLYGSNAGRLWQMLWQGQEPGDA